MRIFSFCKKLPFTILVLSVAFTFYNCSTPEKQFTQLLPDDTGITFNNKLTETQVTNILTYEYSYNGAGVATGDINNDGLADIYFSGNVVANKLYLNKGDLKFEDITETSKTAGRSDWKTGVTMVDVNGDGWLDIYVCYSGNGPMEGYNRPVIREYPNRANQLFINNGCAPGGTPTFTERAKEFGLDAIGSFSTQAYFFDYDLDNDLDMFLVNHANMFYSAFFNSRKLRNLRHPYFGNRLYRNDGVRDSTGNSKQSFHFTDVSTTSGFHGSGLNFGLSASISDLNFDGYPDIYVTNDYEEQDFCYINNGDGTFKEVSHKIFNHLSKFAMGSDIADMNNDGLQDILVLDMLPEDNKRQKLLKGPDDYDRYTLAVDSGYHSQYMRNTLQLNRGFAEDSLPRFSEIGQFSGISNTDWSWSPFFVDLNNDGYKDIFISNGYLRDFTNMDFMKYTSTVYNEAKVANREIDYLTLINQLPQTRLTNYCFRNTNGIQFENVTADWGFARQSVSNGAAYVDLDNDGDYDIVTNNLDDVAGIYLNNQNNVPGNNFLKIRLHGPGYNTQGVGARIKIKTDSLEIVQEAYFTRGYESSIDPVITIGLGKASVVKEVSVQWPDKSTTTLSDVKVNQAIAVDHKQASGSQSQFKVNPNNTVLRDVTKTSGIDFRHLENRFIDFKVQRLLYYQVSRLGGKLSVGDVNSDGNDDVFFGGASGQPGELYLGNDNGTFKFSSSQPWSEDAGYEDISSIFFDADNDGDQDLYVVSGGSEFPAGSDNYQDRLYRNNGKGIFEKVVDALPGETTSGSSVVAADYDKDGDLDLFVGGRHSPMNYPVTPKSFILQNNSTKDKITFTDVTSSLNADLSTVGMVTSALWTDYDKDSWPDLIVTGEWMPIRIFHNEKGKLVELKDMEAISNSNGWWCSIAEADIDGDGDLDYFFGNAGTNVQFKPTEAEPIEIHATDINADGVVDPLLTYYIKGKSYPLATRDELLDQIAPLRKKFIKYEDYSVATLSEIANEEQMKRSQKLKATNLQSCWLENHGRNHFVMKMLPPLAQLSSINAFLFDDFSSGGKQLLAVGNFYPFKPQLGRNDASTGLFLTGHNGQVNISGGTLSNVWLTGDIRDAAILKFKDGKKRVIVSRNDDVPGVYEYVDAKINQ